MLDLFIEFLGFGLFLVTQTDRWGLEALLV